MRLAGWTAAWAWLALTLASGTARAAEIAWRAPEACQRADVAAAQVEKLVGQSLAAIDWIDFEVEVGIAEDGAHRVVLRTLAQGSAPRERAIAGASCAEITDAVSVAIALTISERERAEEQAASSEEPEPAAAPETEATPAPQPAPLGLAIGAGVLVEAGALPSAAPAVDVGVALEWRSLRLGLSVALFVPQETRLANDDRGGTFDFALAGFDVCARPALEAFHLLACAGFELGRIGAQGDGVIDPREGDAAWYAPRAELGAGYGFAKIVRIWLRGGVAVPLARPEFLLDVDDRVHKPGNLSVRGLAAIEILL